MYNNTSMVAPGKILLVHPTLVFYPTSLLYSKFDFSIFNDTARLRAHPTAGRDKYPHIKPNYEAVHVPDMFVGELVL